MTKKIFKSNFEMKSLNLNRGILQVALLVLLFTLGITNAWASDYYTGFKATGGATGKGYVYASTSNTAIPVYETEVTAESQSDDLGSSGATKQYYAWAKAVRGSKFNGWSISGDNGTVTPTSGTDSPITVTVTSAEDKTNTGTATATWTTYTKVNVTYNPSEDGIYSVTYQYDSYNETTKEITTGDAENLSRTISSENGAQTIGSYNNDVITLKSTSGTFQGWYSDAGFTSLLSTDNPYTYTAPTSGSAAVYPKYEHVDKYYGRLTASIAAVPYSMPGGGTIFISKEEAGTGTYSADAQTVDNVGMGTIGLKYYLHAQPTDKRYVFRGWYSNPECTGTALSMSADYTYTFTATSMNSADPTLGNVYAAFDFNLYYMQVEVEPAVPGLGMVLVKDNNTGTPDYTAYASHSEQFLYAYRLAPTANAYLYAKPKYGYKFSGWYDNPDCTGTAKSTANPYTYAATGSSTDPMNPTIIPLYAKFVVDDAKVNITYNIPDKTKGEYTASVLDIAEVDDEFVWTFTEVYNSVGKTGNTTQAQNKTDVLHLEAQPKAGYGVTSWTIAGAAKTTPSHLYETSATAAGTYGVAFGDAKPFLVSAANATTGTQYATLAEALANLGSNKKITVVQNAYVPAGNYTIPSGVTLLIPHDETYAIKEGTTDLEKTYVKPSAYVTLTLGGGARLIVKGNISVSAKMASVGNNAQNGGVCGKYGAIIMETSGSQVSNITLNSGAHLYCWGYIYGDGRVEALSGAEVYEGFVFVDWRGGSNTSGMAYNSQRVFPFNQYYIQNIEVPLTINKGAVEKVFSSVYASSQHNSLSISMIGESSGLFRLTGTGSKLTKWYDPMNDRQHFELEGAASISDISFEVYGINVSSTDYVLPINNNMDIVIKEGASVNITEDVCVMPDATITIEKNATMAIADGANVYVYDKRAYTNAGTYTTSRGGYPSAGAGCYAQAAYIRLIGYSPSWAAIESVRVKRALKTMKSAQFNINGTLAVAGKLYTTEGGADLRSDADGAQITFSSAAGTATITYQVDHSGYNEYYYSIPITPAKLHNGDGSYVVTIGSVSEDKFFYSKSQEKWLKNPKVVSWNANGGTTEASTMAYSEGAFVGELPAAYKDGYTLEGWYTAADGGTKIDATTKVTANITYYAHWTPKSYSITYRDQGGVAFSGTHIDTPTPHPTTHTFGIATPLNGVENKTGYTYGGWYRTPSCSGTVVTTIPASTCKNITLYAKWTLNVHNLTWDANGGTLSGDYTSGEVAYGTTIVVPSVNRENYVFTGWSATPASTMPDNDLTYTAQWAPAVASVTANNVTTNYATIQEAFTAANGKTGATVKLLQDITITSEIALTAAMTIDLNGKTISSSETAAKKGVFKINASGKTVTITDSGTDGKIDHTANCAGYLYGISIIAGSLNIEGGHIYAENTYATSGTAYRAYGINTENNATSITMSGGTIEAKRQGTTLAYGIYTNNTCSLTMESGTITASGSTTIRGIYVKGTTELTNATISSTASGANSYAIFVGAATGNLTIKSGTYTATANGGDEGYTVHESAGSVTINGGRFSGSAKEINKAVGTTSLKGGYYVHNTDLADNCATNYHVLPLTGEDPYKYEVAEAYMITFNVNGHGAAPDAQLVKKNQQATEPSTPIAEGYTFGGWFKEASCTNEWNFSTDYVQGTTELFAKWTMDGVGPKLDIVDWTTSNLTINATAFPSAGWPYTVNNVVYYKDEATATANGSDKYRAADRTLTIPYSGSADDNLSIEVRKKTVTGDIYSRHTYKIPYVYSEEEASLSDDTDESSVVYVNSGSLHIDAETEVDAIYVGSQAELVVNSPLTVNTLVLRTKEFEAASLEKNSTVYIKGHAYYTRIVSDMAYHQFALPRGVSSTDDVFLSNHAACPYGTTWLLKSYDESSRAKNGTGANVQNWKELKDKDPITASVGYELYSGSAYYREFYFPVEIPGETANKVAVSCTKPDDKTTEWYTANSGWNALCSPLLGKYVQNFGDYPEEGLKVSELTSDGHYWQHPSTVIYPAVPFYYQAPETGYLDFSGDKMTILKAPRRAWYTDIPTQWLQLAIRNIKGDKLDETSIYAHPAKFAPEYEIGYDVAKQSLTGGKALIYSELPCGKLAFVAVPDSLAEQHIPLTIYAAAQEEYVFSLAENNYLGRLQHVLLHDMQNGFVTDLLERDYATEINAGTNAGRFYIQCVFAAEAPAVTTGVNSVESNDDAPQKIMYKNKVYIIYQGRVYDMTGRQCELK